MGLARRLDNYEAIDAVIEFIIQAIKEKTIHDWESPNDFESMYKVLISFLNDDNRLQIIVILGQIEATIKKQVFQLEDGRLLSKPIDLVVLKKAEERLCATKFIISRLPEWVLPWALDNIWLEYSSENVRHAFLDLVIMEEVDIDSILKDISRAGKNYIKINKLTEQKATKIFLRICQSIISVCQSRDLIYSSNIGDAIDKFFSEPYSHFTKSQTKINVRKSIIPEVISLLLIVLTHRFSLAIDHEFYSVLKRVRRWCDDKVWYDLYKSNPHISKLSNRISEALILVANQGNCDNDLLQIYKDSVSDEQEYKKMCRIMGDAVKSDMEIKDWLMSGGEEKRIKKTMINEKEYIKRGELVDLGDLILQFYEGESSISSVKYSKNELEIFDPKLMLATLNLVNQWDRLQKMAEKIAERKSVRLLGTKGEKITINPNLYEIVDSEVGHRYGVVVRPAVIGNEGSKTAVIKKGIVKAIKG